MIETLYSWGFAGMLAAAATLVTTALTSTGRPGATVFLLLAVPTGLLNSGVWQAHDWFFPPTHVGVLLVLGAWAVFEHLFRGELYGELMEALPLDQLGALLLIWLLFVGQVALGTSPDVPDVAAEARRLLPVGPALVLLAFTVPLQLAVAWGRNRLVEFLRDIGLGGFASVIELMGVVVGVVGVVFLPVVAAVAAVAIALAVLVGAGISRITNAAIDRSRRRACAHCGHRAREEASRCPSCHGPLEIVRALAEPR